LKSPILDVLVDGAETALWIVQDDLVVAFERLEGRIDHVQIADNRGCHEPGTGKINHDVLSKRPDELPDRMCQHVVF
jgi:sugar phosphate isomerase/epimerase